MRGTKRENAKNATIALLIGIIVAQNIGSVTAWQAAGMGYLMAQIVWVLLICYDEILRKRRMSRRKKNERRIGSVG